MVYHHPYDISIVWDYAVELASNPLVFGIDWFLDTSLERDEITWIQFPAIKYSNTK